MMLPEFVDTCVVLFTKWLISYLSEIPDTFALEADGKDLSNLTACNYSLNDMM